MSAERVADYTRMLDSPTLVARAGWVLGMAAARWRVNNAVLEAMRAGLGRGTYRLVSGAERGPQKFVSAWRLYVPTGLPYEEWLRQ